MNLREAFTIAFRSMRINRLRSALTTLGIVIGVSAVIILVGLGNGMQAGFNENFGKLGTQIVITKTAGSVPGGGAAKDLKDSDVKALENKNNAPDISQVLPVVGGTALMAYNQHQFRANVAGSTDDYMEMANRELVAGRMFTKQEAQRKERLVILGPNPVAELFAGDSSGAIGKNVRVGRVNFEVIGVVKSNGQDDDTAIMPIGAARSYLLGGPDTVQSIIVRAGSTAQVPAALEQVTNVLSEQHLIRDPSKRDFEAKALQSLLDQANQFLFYLQLFTVAVAGISLVVGGIGVANIMLVSVTERTREIGIRKAIGARRSAIMKQFLIESTVLAGIGGLVGIFIGVSITVAGAILIPQVAPTFGAPQIDYTAIAVAFLVSLAIGLIAGGYPANRASKLRPIEALRYQ
ncbi:ABC transporter permease [Pseudonocardia eucalypti]|uniref:ABC transporter permease n=1 Tax=Pseudonocardia eucalypti TaxID=648755 RepID=A0ABP9R1D9_9PSEU|nr:putative ABC transport system permease protein [Pseudonocardia eucalypti]